VESEKEKGKRGCVPKWEEGSDTRQFFANADDKGFKQQERSFDSLRSLPSTTLRASRTTISGVGSPVDSTGVQKPDLIGWSLTGEFFGSVANKRLSD
jgi:hypothetical protein